MDRPLEIPLAVQETVGLLASSTKGWRFRWHRAVFTLMDFLWFWLMLPALSYGQQQQQTPHQQGLTQLEQLLIAAMGVLASALAYVTKQWRDAMLDRLKDLKEERAAALESQKATNSALDRMAESNEHINISIASLVAAKAPRK